jgi:hypothetical protein
MSTASPDIKQRSGKKKTATAGFTTPEVEIIGNGRTTDTKTDILDNIQAQAKTAVKSDWDYKLALAIITILAIVTRFWRITYPDEVVFDEVHFGKVCVAPCNSRALADPRSSPPTTSKAHTSSMCTLRLGSFCSLLQAGSLAMMDHSSLRTLATPTLPTKCHMLPTEQCQH